MLVKGATGRQKQIMQLKLQYDKFRARQLSRVYYLHIGGHFVQAPGHFVQAPIC